MKLTKRLFIPDTHAPEHDPKAFNLMLKVARDFNPDEVIVLGDFFDCYSVSQYSKDPTKNFEMLEEELIVGRRLLTDIENNCPNARLVFLEGNHEHRITRYIHTYAAKLGGSITTRQVLKVPKQWEYLPYGMKGHKRCGKLLVTHGSLCTRYSAAAMASKYGCSVLYGHTHCVQTFTTRNARGERIQGINIGWLGAHSAHEDYVTNVPNSSQAFAVGHFKPNGDYFIQVIEIEAHQLVWRGVLYG